MELLIKIFRFGMVGLSGMVLDFSTTWLCKEKLRMNKYVANTIGFCLAAINNFFLNYKWTFESSDKNMQGDFIKFILFAIAGLVLNNIILFLFHEKRNIRFYPAKALAIVCVFVWNFTTNYFFNFHS